MRISIPPAWFRSIAYVLGAVIVLLIIVLGVVFRGPLNKTIQAAIHSFRDQAPEAEAAEDEHAHGGTDSVKLSPEARKNIGLVKGKIQRVTLTPSFQRTILVPGIIVERPGQTHLSVPTQYTGRITEVHVVEGQAVRPGQLLFKIKLTHEDLVDAQTNYLQTLEERDVELLEVKRLEEVSETGAIAKKTLLEKQYALRKLQAKLLVQEQALLMHDLSPGQIKEIELTRTLKETLSVYAPTPGQKANDPELSAIALQDPVSEGSEKSPPSTKTVPSPLIVQELSVHVGQTVTAGQSLCTLASLKELYIQGQAFEQDLPRLQEVVDREDWHLKAIFPGEKELIPNLEIVYLSNEVHQESRTLHFYVLLHNELLRIPQELFPSAEQPVPNNQEAPKPIFVTWKYRLGQRLQLEIPVEEWTDEIVLPVEAVADEGAESYVFAVNGENFDRIPVHVKFRGSRKVVIAKGGGLHEGDLIAMTGAHQLQMALKNKAGGATDPHAGHHH